MYWEDGGLYMDEDNGLTMGDTPRALLAEARRKILSGELEDIRRERVWEVKSRVRPIIHEELPIDVEIFIEHHPDLYAELVEEVLTEDGLEVLRDEDPELFGDLQDELCSGE